MHRILQTVVNIDCILGILKIFIKNLNLQHFGKNLIFFVYFEILEKI